ncbi:hypothetical protein CHCC20372_0913 [Bacillus paralicheniformis]|nr:hypothetical protein CHCC20372_0913 [Bacillus paralicheniformis]
MAERLSSDSLVANCSFSEIQARQFPSETYRMKLYVHPLRLNCRIRRKKASQIK